MLCESLISSDHSHESFSIYHSDSQESDFHPLEMDKNILRDKEFYLNAVTLLQKDRMEIPGNIGKHSQLFSQTEIKMKLLLLSCSASSSDGTLKLSKSQQKTEHHRTPGASSLTCCRIDVSTH